MLQREIEKKLFIVNYNPLSSRDSQGTRYIMVQFTCTTCSESLDENDMLKHLSATRHKTVVFSATEETLECEECHDTNVHQLSVLRYGGSDMAMMCQLCLSKEEKPSTQYTLSNGSLLKNVANYFKFRDIECEFCESDENLNVGQNKGKVLVVCNDCLQEPFEGQNEIKFTNENEDTFVYDFLGLKEYQPPPSRGRGGVRGRGGRSSRGRRSGRRGGRTGRGRGGKRGARGGGRGGKSSRGGRGRGSTRASTRGSRGSSRMSSRGGHSSHHSTPPISSDKLLDNPQHVAQESSVSSGTSTPSTDISTLVDTINSNLNINTSKKESSVQSKSPNGTNGRKQSNHDKKDKGGKGKGGIDKVLSKKNNGSNQNIPSNSHQNPNLIPLKNNRITNPDKAANTSKVQDVKNPKNPLSVSAKNSKDKVAKVSKPAQIKLPSNISSYIPSPTPKLTYSSMNEYFQEMCFNLFLEEKMAIKFINNVTIEWHKDNDKKLKYFKAIFPYDDDLQDRVSKKLQSIGKLPFSMNQSLGLVIGEDIIWYGFVTDIDVKKDRRGRNIELKIELYKWNTQPLPFNVPGSSLTIMPFSVPVSRIMYAMSRISNPSFTKMLLGNEPIKQIVFHNYLKFTQDTFNDSQKVAIQSVLNNSITVLQGPPGTGKTSTIFEIILQLLDNLNTFPILVVAASNIAIDNIAEKLLPKHSKEILRIVSTEKESEYNKDHPLQSILLHHKIDSDLPNQFRQIKQDFRDPRAHVSQNQYKKLISKSSSIADRLIAQAKVIFTTTVVAGGYQLKSVKKLPVVIMDESTQSSEPTTLIPLSMPGVDRFVFVGDQKQLSAFSQVPNLQLSLFERVLLNGTYRSPHMLNVQYRMHPAISEFPIKRFYNNLLTDGITVHDRTMENIGKPVYFWDTEGQNPERKVRNNFREDVHGFTYENPGEVDKIVEILTNLIFDKKIDKSTIGIITPYRAQRDLISTTISQNDLINPTKEEVHVEVDRDDFFNDSKPVTIHTVSNIMIASIDAFQGREKDFIIFSCVRSNQNNNIGFLNDERRLNVALTRARYGIILVGDVNCLKKGDQLWSDYLSYLDERKSIYGGKVYSY